MDKLWYWTQKQYENTKTSFRETQMSKERFNYQLRMDDDWESYMYLTPKRMTNTRSWLQKEYDAWQKSKYRHDTICFIV